jgi:glutamate racemase
VYNQFCGENEMSESFENQKYAPIGVFDSGVGGLTVAREIMRQLPQERIIYFGDTARVPYGSKSRETIVRYSRQIIHFLESKGVKAIVVACNTASAFALENIRPEMKMPIIGVVKPGAKVAAEITQNGRIGVIGTEGTVGSHIYTEMIHRHNPGATVLGKACPLFVPLVEEGWLKDPVTVQVAKRYLAYFQESDIDTLILGCTHYPLLRAMIREIMGESVNLVNPAYETAQGLKRLLEQHGISNDGKAPGEPMYQFYVSDAAEKFKNFANSILPCEIEEAQLIHIEE